MKTGNQGILFLYSNLFLETETWREDCETDWCLGKADLTEVRFRYTADMLAKVRLISCHKWWLWFLFTLVQTVCVSEITKYRNYRLRRMFIPNRISRLLLFAYLYVFYFENWRMQRLLFNKWLLISYAAALMFLIFYSIYFLFNTFNFVCIVYVMYAPHQSSKS